LVGQGDSVQAVYLLRAGAVKLIHVESSGHEALLGWRFAETFLGAAAALASVPSPVSIETVGAVAVEQIPSEVFASATATAGPVGAIVLRQLAHEVCDQSLHFSRIACLDARHRLVSVLAYFLHIQNPLGPKAGARLMLPGSLADLARSINLRPETVSRHLAELENRGTIKRHRGWILVTRPEEFQRDWSDRPLDPDHESA
jgi:CRP/FNR family transcriptional regulator